MAFDFWDACLKGGEWLLANRERLEDWFSRVTNGVTNVKRWENRTSSRITVKKVDGRNRYETVNIDRNQNKDQDMWISWCNNQSEYPEHNVTIEVDGRPVSYVFQHGANIRISQNNAFDPTAVYFPGFSKAGGERKMIFDYAPDGDVIVRLEPFIRA